MGRRGERTARRPATARLILHTAPPGTETADKLELLRVVGPQRLAPPFTEIGEAHRVMPGHLQRPAVAALVSAPARASPTSRAAIRAAVPQ